MIKRICLCTALLLVLMLPASGCTVSETITGTIVDYDVQDYTLPETSREAKSDQGTSNDGRLIPQDTPEPEEVGNLPDKLHNIEENPSGNTLIPYNDIPDKSEEHDKSTADIVTESEKYTTDNQTKPSGAAGKPDKPDKTKPAQTPKPDKKPAATPKPSASPEKSPEPKSIPYQIEVDVTNQVVTVFGRDESGKYSRVVRQMICSTGKPSTPTPLGSFKIPGGPYDRGVWGYFAKYNTWARYFTRIKGSYMFHSVLYSKKDVSALRKSTVNSLGTPVSHGCIRLTVEDARWIYNNALPGTIVNIVKKDKNPELTRKLKAKIGTGGEVSEEEPDNSKPEPAESPKPAAVETPKPAETPQPAVTPKPAGTPKPTAAPKPAETPEPIQSPVPAPSPQPGESPDP